MIVVVRGTVFPRKEKGRTGKRPGRPSKILRLFYDRSVTVCHPAAKRARRRSLAGPVFYEASHAARIYLELLAGPNCMVAAGEVGDH